MLSKSNLGNLKTILVIALIALNSLLYSCSGNDNGAKTNENIEATEKKESVTNTVKDVCFLITEEEAKEILGGTVKPGMITTTMCQYISGSDELSKAGESVSLQLYPGAADGIDSYIASTERNLNVKPKLISDVGDKAAFAAGQFIVSKGKDFMVIIVGKNMAEEELIAVEKTIAQKAIIRLGEK